MNIHQPLSQGEWLALLKTPGGLLRLFASYRATGIASWARHCRTPDGLLPFIGQLQAWHEGQLPLGEGVQPEAEMFAFAGFTMFQPPEPGMMTRASRRLADWWTGRAAA